MTFHKPNIQENDEQDIYHIAGCHSAADLWGTERSVYESVG